MPNHFVLVELPSGAPCCAAELDPFQLQVARSVGVYLLDVASQMEEHKCHSQFLLGNLRWFIATSKSILHLWGCRNVNMSANSVWLSIYVSSRNMHTLKQRSATTQVSSISVLQNI